MVLPLSEADRPRPSCALRVTAPRRQVTVALTAAIIVLAAARASGGPLVAQEAAAQPPREVRDAAPAIRPDRDELAHRLLALLEDPALKRAHVGLMVQVAETGEVLFAQAAEKRFVAASTAKLVTAAVALQRLGADYRWRTRLVATGQIRNDSLLGDLWVVGGGDPRLTSRDLRGWPPLLRAAGIRHITGDVVGDDRSFTGPPWGRGWMWEDLYAGWGAGVSGLQLSPARIRAELIPGPEVGSPAHLRWLDPGPAPSILNRARTGAPTSEVEIYFEPSLEGGPVRLVGWIPAGRDPVPLSLAPDHPTHFLLDNLRAVLSDSGISVAGRVRRSAEDERPVAQAWSRELTSETLGEVVEDFLKHSDNQVGETLLRTLGLEVRGLGSADGGLEVVRETLARWAIEPGSVALVDGSGLSRYTTLTPAALTRLLRRSWQLPGFDPIRRALPLASRDGTLARRLEATAAEGNARAKTGSLAGVRALAGYVTDADQETLIFTFILNGFDAPGDVAAALEDLLLEQLALYHGSDYLRSAAPPPPDGRP